MIAEQQGAVQWASDEPGGTRLGDAFEQEQVEMAIRATSGTMNAATPAVVAIQVETVAAQDEQVSTVFFKIPDFPPEATETDLRELFTRFGSRAPIISLPKHPDQSLKGFGFVSYESPETARLAITALNGSAFFSRQVQAQIYVPRGSVAAVRSDMSEPALPSRMDSTAPFHALHEAGRHLVSGAGVSTLREMIQASGTLPFPGPNDEPDPHAPQNAVRKDKLVRWIKQQGQGASKVLFDIYNESIRLGIAIEGGTFVNSAGKSRPTWVAVREADSEHAAPVCNAAPRSVSGLPHRDSEGREDGQLELLKTTACITHII